MIFHVHYDRQRKQFLECLFRCADILEREHGIRVVDRMDTSVDPKAADGYILHRGWITPGVLDLDKPIIYAERRDSSVVYWREHLSHPNLRAVLKLSLADFAYQNLGRERVHAVTPGESQKPLSLEEYEKCVVAPWYFFFGMMSRWKVEDFPINRRRKHRATFHGKTNYPNCPAVADHRQRAIYELNSKAGCIGSSSRLSFAVYQRYLKESYCVVSPFGYGELCWRDAEAIMAGCALIKPYCPWLRVWPNPFFYRVYTDLDELSSGIDDIMSRWSETKDIVDARQSLWMNYNRPEKLVEPFLEAFKRCL